MGPPPVPAVRWRRTLPTTAVRRRRRFLPFPSFATMFGPMRRGLSASLRNPAWTRSASPAGSPVRSAPNGAGEGRGCGGTGRWSTGPNTGWRRWEAADAANCLAIIPYEPHMLPRTPECPRPPEAAREHRDPGPASDPFEHARRGELEDLIRAIRETGFDPARETDGHGSTCLHWAAGSGHLRVVKHLIESCSCCPDAGQQGKRSFRGRTALHWAARNGKLGVVQYLVEKGASVDAKTIDGTTAFCWASWQGHLDVMQYLHARGSDVHASNSFGCNAILWAAQGVGGLDVMRWLHSIRCDIFQVNANGHSVVHKSAQRGNRKVIEWMCSSHKRRSVSLIGPDQEGCRPSDLARMEGHSELAGWLRTLETTLHVTR